MQRVRQRYSIAISGLIAMAIFGCDHANSKPIPKPPPALVVSRLKEAEESLETAVALLRNPDIHEFNWNAMPAEDHGRSYLRLIPGDPTARFVHEVSQARHLKTLLLPDGISDVDLLEIGKLTQLEFLGIDSRAVRGPGLVHLASLDRLRVLRLVGSLDSQAMTHLPSFQHLEELELHSCATDLEVEILSHANLPRLKTLDLSASFVTDAAASSLERMTNLEHVTLYNTRITDAGLSRIARLPRLKTLSFGLTYVSEAGAMQVKRAYPSLHIEGGS